MRVTEGIPVQPATAAAINSPQIAEVLKYIPTIGPQSLIRLRESRLATITKDTESLETGQRHVMVATTI